MQELLATFDRLMPGYHPVSVVMTAVILPSLLWLAGFRWQWRDDRRKTDESIMALTMHLVDQQRTELGRLVGEAEALRRQLDLMMASRYRVQDAIDALREQAIASRVLIHDYERRLGLPETAFPNLPAPTLTDRYPPSNHPEAAMRPS